MQQGLQVCLYCFLKKRVHKSEAGGLYAVGKALLSSLTGLVFRVFMCVDVNWWRNGLGRILKHGCETVFVLLSSGLSGCTWRCEMVHSNRTKQMVVFKALWWFKKKSFRELNTDGCLGTLFVKTAKFFMFIKTLNFLCSQNVYRGNHWAAGLLLSSVPIL